MNYTKIKQNITINLVVNAYKKKIIFYLRRTFTIRDNDLKIISLIAHQKSMINLLEKVEKSKQNKDIDVLNVANIS